MNEAKQRTDATGLPFLSIVSPCYNEQEVIQSFYEKLNRILTLLSGIRYEILFIDDGSSDETLSILNRIAATDKHVNIYSFSRNFGHQVALTAGIEAAKGDAVLMMDSDLQHPPELIPVMIEKWKEGYEIVSAVREKTEGTSFLKNVLSKAFYKTFNYLCGIKIPEGVADFCLLSKRAHQELLKMNELHRFLRGMVTWIGFKRAFIPYVAKERFDGKSKYNATKMISMAKDALFSFSSKPLKLATCVGMAITFLGLLYLNWIVIRFFIVGDLVLGWGSLICVMLILGGFQITFMGLIGQYIARIFEEVKNRPLYVLKQKPHETHDGNE